MKGDLWKAAIVLVFLALMLPAVGVGFESAETQETIEDEPIELEYDEAVEVENADIATDDPVTVLDADGEELQEGEDYEWHEGNITALEPDLDGEQATITYETATHTDETLAISQVLGVFDGWIAIIFLFVIVAAVLSMAFGSGFGGR